MTRLDVVFGTMTMRWQASQARHKFTDLIDAAVKGEPQYVRRRDGREVVVVSREYFERTLPTLKDFLLTDGFAGEREDAFDSAMRDIRSEGGPFMATGAANSPE